MGIDNYTCFRSDKLYYLVHLYPSYLKEELSLTSATSSVYFANQGVITVAGASGTPAAVTLAVVKDVTVSVEWEHAEAYGWGTVQRVGVAKHTQKVSVKVGWIKFAPKLAEWFPFYIGDSAAGGGTLVDTNAVTLFTITAQFTPLDATGTVKLLRTVTGVYFPKFPITATEGQFMKVDMEGTGVTLVDTNPA